MNQEKYKIAGVLTGLKGVSKDINCTFFKKAEEVEGILKSNLAATTAGFDGAINVWKDDNGLIRCELMKFFKTIEEKIFMPDEIRSAEILIARWLYKIKRVN